MYLRKQEHARRNSGRAGDSHTYSTGIAEKRRPTWWEYYRLVEMPEEDLFDEPSAVAGLEFVERVEVVVNKRTRKPTGSVIDRYRYPPQEMEIRRGDEMKLTDGAKFGDIVHVDRTARTLDVRKGKKQAETHPTALFAHSHVPTDVLEDAIFRNGQAVANGAGATLVERLLRADSPTLRTGPFVVGGTESAVEFAVRVANELDSTVLAIQGPPGAGKTFTGARMICALVEQGKRVGVTATSHKVIRNLLDAITREAGRLGIAARLAQKVGEAEEGRQYGQRGDRDRRQPGSAEAAPRWRCRCPWGNCLALGQGGLCSGSGRVVR